MSYTFRPGMRYRMPTHFGPFPGPRQIPAGKPNDPTRSPRCRLATATALTEREALEKLLPPGFTLDGEPTLSIAFEEITEIDWLAGRGYNTFGVRCPVLYAGKREQVHGNLLFVLWENLADPIISGREELGFNKIYCELPEPTVLAGDYRYRAGWLGHQFFEMSLSGLTEQPAPSTAPRPSLHYKYFPKTGAPGEADAAYVTMTPTASPNTTIEKRIAGNVKFSFRESTWEQLPTLYHIVNAFAALPLLEFRGGAVTWTRGGKDLSDQRIVE